MTPTRFAALPHATPTVMARSLTHRLRQSSALTAVVLGAALSGTAAQAGCPTIGTAYPCTGATDQTVDAGGADNLVYSGGATGKLTVNGEAGADTVVFDLSSILSAHSGTTIANGGVGADTITVQASSVLTGDILGDADADSLLIDGGSTINGTVDGGTGNDTIQVRGDSQIVGALNAGDGDDLVTLQDGSSVTGTVSGGAGNDFMLLEGGQNGASTITGQFEGGDGADALRVRGQSTVQGDMLGGTGADALVVTDTSTVNGSMEGDDDADQITVQDNSTVTGDVVGGDGNDSLLVETQGTVLGFVDGGVGDDTINVTSGSVQGGITSDAGNDTITLSGGTIGGYSEDVKSGLLDLGAGSDTLVLSFDETLAADALDISGIVIVDGGLDDGIGAIDTDTALVHGFGEDADGGGLMERSFANWDSVTFSESLISFSNGTASVSDLRLTAATTLFQTNGALALLGRDQADSATLFIDSTSAVDMGDDVKLFSPFGFGALPPSVADDSISVAQLNLTGNADPLAFPTLVVDFDADDSTRLFSDRDDALRGNADHISVSNSITAAGVIGVRINAVGGYGSLGLPTTLSGSVVIIDDVQALALVRPGVGANLVASLTYVADSNLPDDPALQWALVDQGTGGVALQWTTTIDALTTGPNGAAELSLARSGTDVLANVAAGVTDGTMAKRSMCALPDAVSGRCLMAPVTVWAMAGDGQTKDDAKGGVSGSDSQGQYLVGGVEYALDATWNAGLFGALHQGSSDLGSVLGAFGPRYSQSDATASYLGVYAKAEQNGLYFTGVGMIGRAKTDLVNGVLFDATSTHASTLGLLGATAGKRIALTGGSLTFDPRIEASYATSGGETYTDSAGLMVSSKAQHGRVAATLGLTYAPEQSPLSLALRVGTAVLHSSTSVEASEAGFGATIGSAGDRTDNVFTASVEGSWTLNAQTKLTGSLAVDHGDDIHSARGGLAFVFAF